VKQAFHTVRVSTHGPGLTEFTDAVMKFAAAEKIGDGLLTCFIRHTSASLLVQENADPDVLKDMQDFFAQLASRGINFRHTAEGPDDMPSHIRSALTATSVAIPVRHGKPALGTWQGLYVFEHRDAPHTREVVLHFIGD
jgi:secondary thiamine-phosphate synthase enzyme